MDNILFDKFINICRSLNAIDIKSILMGSLGLELVSKESGCQVLLTFMFQVTPWMGSS